MNYTKGERYVGCSDEHWFVASVSDSHIIGRFTKKEDALLDSAAPAMCEALKEAQKVVDWVLRKQTGYISDIDIVVGLVNDQAKKALAKAEGKQ